MTTPVSTALARRFRVDIDTAWPAGPATWTQFLGVTDLKGIDPKPVNKARVTYDTDGWQGSQKTMQEISPEITFQRDLDATGGPLTCHEVVRAALDAFGEDGTVHIRWYDRSGLGEAYEFYGIPAWERSATGVEDLEMIKLSLTDIGRGRIPITNPLA